MFWACIVWIRCGITNSLVWWVPTRNGAGIIDSALCLKSSNANLMGKVDWYKWPAESWCENPDVLQYKCLEVHTHLTTVLIKAFDCGVSDSRIIHACWSKCSNHINQVTEQINLSLHTLSAPASVHSMALSFFFQTFQSKRIGAQTAQHLWVVGGTVFTYN